MRTISLVISILFLSTIILQGQIESYPLSEYKRPELHRSTLVLDGSFDSDNQFRSNSDDDLSQHTLDVDLFYTKFENTQSTQKTMGHSTRTDFFIDLEKEENKVRANLSHLSSMSVRRFDEVNQFIGYSPSISISSTYNKDQDTPNRVTLSSPIGIGKGRVEIVNDAWLATSILQSLKNENLLKREPSHEEITLFAEEIGRIKNARVLDFRMKRIYELDEIYKFIVNLALVDENTLAFAVVYDAWQFEIFDTRRTGSIIQTFISPQYTYLSGEFNFDQVQGAWSASYIYHKPISLKWERSYTFSVFTDSRYTTNTVFIPKFDQFKDNIRVGFNASYNLDYYLSRRTYFSWNNAVRFSETLESDFKAIDASTRFGFVNWISAQVRFSGSARLTSSTFHSEFFKRSTVSPDVSIALQYSIF